MHGLTRVRGMTQDDSHSYVTAEQAPAEIKLGKVSTELNK